MLDRFDRHNDRLGQRDFLRDSDASLVLVPASSPTAEMYDIDVRLDGTM